MKNLENNGGASYEHMDNVVLFNPQNTSFDLETRELRMKPRRKSPQFTNSDKSKDNLAASSHLGELQPVKQPNQPH